MALRAMTEGEITITFLFFNKEGLDSLLQSANADSPLVTPPAGGVQSATARSAEGAASSCAAMPQGLHPGLTVLPPQADQKAITAPTHPGFGLFFYNLYKMGAVGRGMDKREKTREIQSVCEENGARVGFFQNGAKKLMKNREILQNLLTFGCEKTIMIIAILCVQLHLSEAY